MSTSRADRFRLDGRVALVTGASSGLGARFAAVLHAAGAERGADRPSRGPASAAGRGPWVRGQPLCRAIFDEPSTRSAVMARVTRQFGRLDVLVNNAGVCDGGPLQEQSLADVIAVIDLNLVAAIDLCRLAAPLLLAHPGSSVINVTSIFGLVGSRAPMAGYNASKGALVHLTRHLAAQWGERGVRVNGLAPGFFPTELTGGLSDPGQRTRIEQRTLLGRIPDLAEIDGPLLFLASDAASYVTGQILTVDGGWTAT